MAAQQREQELLHQAHQAALRRVAAAWLGLVQQRQTALAEQYAVAAAQHMRRLQQRLPQWLQGWRHVAHLQQWQRQQVRAGTHSGRSKASGAHSMFPWHIEDIPVMDTVRDKHAQHKAAHTVSMA
jgi:hypothetical protein